MLNDNLNITGYDHILIVDETTKETLLNKRGEQPKRKDVVKDKK